MSDTNSDLLISELLAPVVSDPVVVAPVVSDPVDPVSVPVEVAPVVSAPAENAAPITAQPADVDFAEVFATPEDTAGLLAVLTVPYVSVTDQHVDSGYRPVGGAEVKDYLDAKGMGLEGRPSKAQVREFLVAKGVRE